MSDGSMTVTISSKAGPIDIGVDKPLVMIAGPCALESRAHALECAAALKEISARLKAPLIFKTSFDKANRTSAGAARGSSSEAPAASAPWARNRRREKAGA